MRVKICGIAQAEQARAIAQLGATALGFICVEASPRYVSPVQIRTIVDTVVADEARAIPVTFVGVFANAPLPVIESTVAIAGLSAIQLHGSESPDFCQQLRTALPNVEIIKALRVKTPESLQQIAAYEDIVDGFLLDAYHPDQLGGTGKTLDWPSLQTFRPGQPWFLAGGLNPDNILSALDQTHPDGIDLSSGLERSPGDKNLSKVQQLFATLQHAGLV
ncbi:MAG: phosphoribosylanthranilate isomerase [Cyanobacteria bacterium P01_A01_bin.123]